MFVSMISEYDLMQRAVDIVQQSEHPTNKVSAVLSGRDPAGKEFSLARTNFWPDPIKASIGIENRIGTASGTIHAETACLLHAPMTNGAAIYVTDVPCPNCVKNMAEAGVKTMYIDHKGFTKDFALRRGGHFDNMALRICEKAGISIYRIYRKDKKLEPILKISDGFSPVIEKPARIMTVTDALNAESFSKLIESEREFYQNRAFAVAIASGTLGKLSVISAETHPCPGYTAQTVEKGDEKYSTILQPVNRVMMMAARYGMKIDQNYFYSSRVPTARELVDMVGAKLTKISIGDPTKARDNDALAALEQLKSAAIIAISA
jgi:deoxycytidylate deaminase